jgi:hypothetical protein
MSFTGVNEKDPASKVQRDSVITREDNPGFGFRVLLFGVVLLPLLLVASIYYGLINP